MGKDKHMMLAQFINGDALIWAGLGFGFIFGLLLQKGGVTNYNVIINQFRLKDFTVVKIMLTAIVVGGIGVWFLAGQGMANYHIKSADLLGLAIGGVLFGIGMVIYGYCPGTGVAAVATGSIHALVGFVGMIVGGILYGVSYPWIAEYLLPIGRQGKIRLPEVISFPEWSFWLVLTIGAVGFFFFIHRLEQKGIVDSHTEE